MDMRSFKQEESDEYKYTARLFPLILMNESEYRCTERSRERIVLNDKFVVQQNLTPFADTVMFYDKRFVLTEDYIDVNNKKNYFENKAYIKDGVYMVPFREFIDSIRIYYYDMSWNDLTKEASCKLFGYGDEIVFKDGSKEFMYSGESFKMDTEAEIKNERIYVPFRNIMKTIGRNFEFYMDENTKTDVAC